MQDKIEDCCFVFNVHLKNYAIILCTKPYITPQNSQML